jgi:hypothetical protein
MCSATTTVRFGPEADIGSLIRSPRQRGSSFRFGAKGLSFFNLSPRPPPRHCRPQTSGRSNVVIGRALRRKLQAACDKIIAYKDDSLVNLFTFFRCDMGKPNGNTHQRKDRDNFEVHPVTVFADSPIHGRRHYHHEDKSNLICMRRRPREI